MSLAPSPSTTGPARGDAASLRPADFAAIADIMQSDARIHLSDAKTTLVESRLARRLRLHGLDSYADYVRLLHSDAQERSAMVVSLTTNHTHFFREAHHFDHLREKAMPWLEAQSRHRPIRIWSAACSTGEEVYSIAMCLLGTSRTPKPWLRNGDVRLLATDIAPHVVEATRDGTYAASGVAAVPAPYRTAWMHGTGDTVVMDDAARALVSARVLNLFEPWPMRRQFDVIFCRNVMIYFNDAAKAELEARLIDSLAPGGFLYIGHSERLAGPSAAQMINCGQTIYRKPEHGA
jgi:chemotaxis protein methyltransferase CheR